MMASTNKTRCRALTKSGKQCRAAPLPGGLCFFHANPNKAAELGRIGGKKNRHARADATDSLPDMKSALAVREVVSRLIIDVYSGRVNPRIASGLAPLLSLQLRAIDSSDLERRIAEIEKQLAEGKLSEPADEKEVVPRTK